jgi:tetratricopeptide (TPR) repeat protein
MFKKSLFLVFIFISSALFAQKSNRIDSLKATFETLKPSKYLEISKTAVTLYGDKRMQAHNKIDIGNHLRNLGKYDASIKIHQEAFKIYQNIKDMQGIGAAYNSLAVTYKILGNDKVELYSYVDKALKYALFGKEYYEKANDTGGFLKVYSNIGIIYRDLKRFPEAEESYLDGLDMAKSAGMDDYNVGVLYSNLSQIYLDYYKNYDKAIFYLNKALANYQKKEIHKFQEHIFRNLAYNYTQ